MQNETERMKNKGDMQMVSGRERDVVCVCFLDCLVLVWKHMRNVFEQNNMKYSAEK